MHRSTALRAPARLAALTLAAFAALLTVAPAPPARAAENYTLDAAHASVYFHADHMGLSRVYGRFNQFDASVTLDGENSRFSAEIQTASVDTGNQRRDNHLRSPDFFSARQYPTITFESTAVEVDGETYRVTGDLTMHGQTKQVTLPLTMLGKKQVQGKEKIGFAGELTIDRREWGLDAWQGMVGNEVVMAISFEAQKQ